MAREQTQIAVQPAAVLPADEFSELLQREFKPRTDEAGEAVASSVRILAQQALARTRLIDADAIRTIEAIIAELDRKLSEQVNQIIHHPDFQQLESAWRGLHYLVSHAETDEQLKIRVANVSKAELGKTLRKFRGTAWTRAPCSRRSTRRNTASLAASPLPAWWETTTSTTARRMSNCSARWPRSRQRHMRPSSRGPRLQ